MEQICKILFLIISYIIIFIYTFAWEWDNEPEDYFILPKWFYTYKKLNWFGSWVMFILLCIFNPFGFVIKIGYFVCNSIKWLFTVGR